MEKRNASNSQRLEGLTQYEKLRNQRLQFNAERMEVAGFKSLANKVLLSSSKEKQPVDEEMPDGESDYEPSDHDQQEEEEDLIAVSENNQRRDKHQVLPQKLSMVQFAKTRAQKMRQYLLTQQQSKEQNSQQNENLNVQPQLKQHAVPKVHQQQQKTKKMAVATPSTKKSEQVQFFPPGHLSMYKSMRQKQLKQQQQKRSLEDCLDNEPSADELEGPLEDVLSTRQERNFDMDEDILQDEDILLDDVHDICTAIDRNDVPQHQTTTNETANLGVPQMKKRRGPTTMFEVHRRKLDERETIILNASDQPIGPTSAVVAKFSRFLGTVARSPHLTPLNYVSWKYVPTKEKIWDYVMERYIVPEEGKQYVMDTINALWRVYKSRLKGKHYEAYDTDEERLMNRPGNIPINQFEQLLEYWNSDLAKEISSNNKRSRGLQADVHTMGPSSYALLRHELQQKDPNKQPPSQARVYKESRKRITGRTYKTNNEKMLENIEKMDAMESHPDENGEGSIPKDPYCEVVAKGDRNGQLRLYGRGVTKSKLEDKGKDNTHKYIFPTEFLQSIKADLIREVAPDLAATVVSQIEAANPGVHLKIPEILVSRRNTIASATSGQSHGQSNETLNKEGEEEEFIE